jgi:DNA-directed RNA polymerase subunit RPC12/RpoP
MEIERCRNNDCGRPFSVDEIGGAMPGSKEPEEIRCPNCGFTYTQRSNGYFNTHALSPKAEEKYNREHPV